MDQYDKKKKNQKTFMNIYNAVEKKKKRTSLKMFTLSTWKT